MGESPDTGPTDESAVGKSGARFPSSKQLKKIKNSGHAAEPEIPPPPGRWQSPPTPPAGARFPSAKQVERFAAEEEPEPIPEPEPRPSPSPHPRYEREPEPEEHAGPRVRPYVLTKGRTRSRHELAIETLVSIRPDARWEGPALSTEYQGVRALCVSPRSVAEVAAILSVPLGVARVLLSDMAELHLVQIHGTAMTAQGRPPMALMQRVLDGLHRL